MRALLKTLIRLQRGEGEGRPLLAFADVTVAGTLTVRSLRVLRSKDGEPYVAFPMRRSPNGAFFEVVSPATPKAREEIKKAVLRAFGRARGAA